MRTMKGISLWQPYGTAMANGFKKNETRSWPTKYRGDIVICAAKRRPKPREFPDTDRFDKSEMRDLAVQAVPFGAALCIVELYDCQPSDLFAYRPPFKDGGFLISPLEFVWGDYSPGRWVFMTRNVRKLKEPVPVAGRQRIFNLPSGYEKLILAKL